jgi:iron(III) transport system ATP-binding protein
MGRPMNAPPCLEIAALTHGYGARTVLDRVAFQAATGEVICLLGRSGCGKTTLLRLISGLEKPRDGRISINGQNFTAPGIFVPPDKRGIGMMFQDYALFPHLTALENTNFGRKPAGAPDAMALLSRVGLDHAAHRYPHTLSAGEQQRVALVRALVSQPTLLLMDEPFSNLDGGTRDDVRRLTLALLRETRTTAVIVTHDPAEAMTLADRIVLLHEGRVEQIATPTELYRRPRSLFAARYFSELNEVARAGSPAYLRPHDLELVDPAAGMPLRVTDVSYTGENTRITLAGAGGPMKASLRGIRPVNVGDYVGVKYDAKDLLAFPVSETITVGR